MAKSNHTEAQMIGTLSSWKQGVKRNTWRGRRRVEAHDLRLESKIRGGDGCEPGAGSEAPIAFAASRSKSPSSMKPERELFSFNIGMLLQNLRSTSTVLSQVTGLPKL